MLAFTGVRYNDGGPGGNIFIINECDVLGLKRGRVIIGIGFYNQHNHETPPSPMKSQQFLKLGKYPFSIQPGSIVKATRGVMVSYLEERNDEWVSQAGPQNSSSCEITKISTMKEGEKINTLISIRFHCLVYNMYNESRKVEGVMRNILFSSPLTKNDADKK